MHKELESLYKAAPLYRELFDKQLEVALCPKSRVAVLCSRRAGKTEGTLLDKFQVCMLNPDSLGLYLALTDKSVYRIVMPIARKIIAKYKIPAEIIGDDIVFKNGSIISVLGANHTNKIEGFRGTKLLFCVLDEAASFNEEILRRLIDQIIEPALMDLKGVLTLLGTPAAHCRGLFYDATTGIERGWAVFRWTGYDNPYVNENFAELIHDICNRKKIDINHPYIRREYGGEWIADTDSLMIRPFFVDSDIEPYDINTWKSVVGVDLGFDDKTAFTVIGWKLNNPKSYILESKSYAELGVSDIVSHLSQLKAKYKPVKIVIPPDTGGKMLIEEFSTRYKIFCEQAEKSNKAHYVELLNDALVNQELVLTTNTEELQRQMKSVVWNEDRTRELEGQKCDELDAMLYAFRSARYYIEKVIVKVVKTNKEIEQEMIQKVIQQDTEAMNARKGDSFFTDIGDYLNG